MKREFFLATLTVAFTALTVLCPNLVQAQDINFQEYRKFLMSGDTANKKVAIQTTCTTADGEVYRIGEKSYDACLNAIQNSQKNKKSGVHKSEDLKSSTDTASANSASANSGLAEAASTGVTIRLGE